MDTLEQYRDKVFAAHPELVDQYLAEDLADAENRKAEAQTDIDSLTEMKYTLHPELRPTDPAIAEDPAEEATEQVEEVETPPADVPYQP